VLPVFYLYMCSLRASVNWSMLHPTRLSLSASGATPQAAQPPGMRKKRLEWIQWSQHHRRWMI
jgi:hypothetical protein